MPVGIRCPRHDQADRHLRTRRAAALDAVQQAPQHTLPTLPLHGMHFINRQKQRRTIHAVPLLIHAVGAEADGIRQTDDVAGSRPIAFPNG